MIIETEHFNPTTDPKLLCTCGHKDCDKRSVNMLTLNMLEQVRVIANRPLTVTSGGRCPSHANEVHRTTPADHQKCNAVDISVRGGVERSQIMRLGVKCGFNAIGVAKTFVHLGFRDGERPVVWTY
jgi:zinc D-Ala-D-Ala carboxypeptidase